MTKEAAMGDGYGAAGQILAGETEHGERVWLHVDKLGEVTAALHRRAKEATENLTSVQVRCTELVEERRAVDWTADVRTLFSAFEQRIPERVGWPDDATVRLRRKMIREEYDETMLAIDELDFPEFVDGCIDLIVVTLGALVACGVDPVPVWRAVQTANLTKAGGPVSSDGKRMKPPGFVPPDVAALLVAQGWTPPAAGTPKEAA